MKNILVMLGCLLSCVLVPTTTWAQLVSNTKPAIQSRESDLDLREVSHQPIRLAQLIGNADNVSILSQIGNSNEAFIRQAGDDNTSRLAILGDGNKTEVIQEGRRNFFDMDLVGNNNPVSVKQFGNNNVYDMDLNASNTPINLVQNGTSNRVVSNLMAATEREYSIRQYGNNNVLNQAEGNASVLQKGYSVEMRGNGIRMTIEQGRVTP